MVDDAGTRRLDVELAEPTRISVDRDPLFVYSRLEALVERGMAQLHEQALRINRETDRGRGVAP